MAIDLDEALNARPATREISWTRRDVLLYHLSLGAGARADTEPELPYTYEGGLQVLPTFAMVAGQGISAGDRATPGLALPGIDIDLRKILHAGQALRVHRPPPASGTATVTSRVADVWDKGKAAVIVLESTAADGDGTALWTTTMQIWARGEGGFGGEPGPDVAAALPEREPDVVLESPTTPAQALIYRLNGDMNPLHADPGFARAAGFDRPILHGLASYGLVAKAIVDGLLDGDAARLRAFEVRFAGTLLPGETIRTAVWRDGGRLVLRSTCPERDDAPVLTHATAEVAS
ncbi:MaoC/PaaZ C-terminal domain-containing protein [Saccharopolyspora elongata]|uniref:3-alpha,7-alpha, 12-alpha-trihydroxy-5-beta-cholest-24-enoyl-CoA hydratase n=1 Tax=Saccharopolyspora elongata TaxID=2530387 RepID=A0A4R4XTJ0_9PSEU|nr:MaoC/PaaZ C-terminal domain-containing protein [Saccharopolyspora elongata]TDD34530.1 3-alpha,7-alpha,12-alpha-trihydroxy-5-beta-cholest-24-enoyl-CoA hydratase [Saccharopolyspora elongata]